MIESLNKEDRIPRMQEVGQRVEKEIERHVEEGKSCI